MKRLTAIDGLLITILFTVVMTVLKLTCFGRIPWLIVFSYALIQILFFIIVFIRIVIQVIRRKHPYI
jgi:hypothetical protein